MGEGMRQLIEWTSRTRGRTEAQIGGWEDLINCQSKSIKTLALFPTLRI